MAKKEVGHLHLFPTEFPNREIGIVIDIVRRKGDHTMRDQIEAAWWVAGYGASMIPDEHPPQATAPATEEEMATQFEAAVAANDAGAMRAFPWALFLPIILKIIERLVNR